MGVSNGSPSARHFKHPYRSDATVEHYNSKDLYQKLMNTNYLRRLYQKLTQLINN